MSERHKVTQFLGSLKKNYSDCSLPEFLKQIDEIVAPIPEDQREHILVYWVDPDPLLDEDEPNDGYIEFEFWRDETDGEMAERIQRRKKGLEARDRAKEAQEREEYERLKAKYG